MPRANAGKDATAVEKDLDRLESVNKGLAAALNAQRGESQPQGGTATMTEKKDGTPTTLKDSAVRNSAVTLEEPLDLIQRLQRQGDTYTRKIETEKRLIANLRNNLDTLQTKVDQQRQQMGGIGGAEGVTAPQPENEAAILQPQSQKAKEQRPAKGPRTSSSRTIEYTWRKVSLLI